MLGLNIYNIFHGEEGGDQEQVNLKKVVGLCLMKLVIVPLIGSPVVFYFQSQGFIEDPVLVFLMLFTLASPTAINILVICNLKKAWVHYMSLIMSFTYLFCMVTITLNNSIFLYLLSSSN
jgi:predicted permease